MKPTDIKNQGDILVYEGKYKGTEIAYLTSYLNNLKAFCLIKKYNDIEVKMVNGKVEGNVDKAMKMITVYKGTEMPAKKEVMIDIEADIETEKLLIDYREAKKQEKAKKEKVYH